ncbi:MAG: PAS domain S-box protein [Leptolyngbyaceae cyanobacterium bins.349]|nr:PAS domain S-box protein [Leptolyngbyaceae cyanobacterium bins.349]
MVLLSQSWTADDFDRELAHLRTLLEQKSQELDETRGQLQQERAGRQALEQELATQKARFDAFFQAANIGMVMIDTELRHVQINPALAAINGLPVAAHKGKTLSEILPDVARTVEPVYRRVLATGEALFNVEVQGATLKQPHITRHWVNSYFPLKAADGSLLGAGAVVVDVTASKQVEAQLQQTLQELNYHIENSPLATVEWDQNLQVRRWSKRAEQMFAWQADDVAGLAWQDLMVESDRPRFNAMIGRLLNGTEHHNVCRSRSYTQTGAVIDCEWYNSVLLDEAGRLKSVLSLVLDVTLRQRAETQLRNREKELNLALSAAEMGIWHWHAATNQVTFSAQALQLLHLQPEDFDGSHASFLRLVHPDDRDRVANADTQGFTTGFFHEMDYRVIRSDGTVRWIRERGDTARDEMGQSVGLIGIMMDITAQKQAEESLRQSEARNRAMLSAVPDLMIRMNREGIWLDYLPPKGFQHLLPPAEVIGRNVYDILPHDIAQQRMEYVELAFQTQEPQLHEFEMEVDGKILYEEARIVVCGDREVLTMVRDITERKQAETALYESEAQNRALFNAIPDIIIQMRADGRYLNFKPGKTVSVLNADLIRCQSTTIFDVLPPDLAVQRLHYIHEALRTGDVQSYEYQMTVNGEIRDEEARIVCCGEDEAMCIIRDISDRKQTEVALKQQAAELEQALQQLQLAQAKLVHSEKMSSLGQLVAGIAHEINNPINFIYGNLEYAASYTQDLLELVLAYQREHPHPSPQLHTQLAQVDLTFVQDDLPKLLTSMRNGTERIREIVKSLRTFSRLDEADMKTVDLHEGIDSALMILQNRLHTSVRGQAIRVVKHYGDLPKVECYAGQLNQVFMNLLTNAIDALDQCPDHHCEPTIQIHTEIVNAQQVQIRIRDNGIGIPKEIQSQIFNPFFTTKPIGQGTGLGLPTSYQIVTEKHKGILTYHSTPGAGTEFIIRIPMIQDAG